MEGRDGMTPFDEEAVSAQNVDDVLATSPYVALVFD